MDEEMIRDHYEAVCETKLVRQRNEIVRRFEHELSEILIELGGDDPRPDMTIARVVHMQKYIRRLKAGDIP